MTTTESTASLKDRKRQVDIEVRRLELDIKRHELVKAKAEAVEAGFMDSTF